MVRFRLFLVIVISIAALSAWAAGAEVRIGSAAPLTGQMSWHGEQHQQGLELAVAALNQAGGVLGETVEVVTVDDYCDGTQALAAAAKLIADDVVAVVGHNCSGAAIPASAAYEAAGIVMISNTATNPKLTDQGFRNIFRMVARDTLQGEMAAAYLANHWPDGRVAILHDGQAYGQGLAEETRRQLEARGGKAVIFEQIAPGQADYAEILARLQAAGVAVLFYGGYQSEAALLIRQARDRDYDLQMIGSDALFTEYFWRVAGPAAVGVRFVSMADPRANDAAAPAIEKFRAQGYEPEGLTLYSYAAVEVWAQAVEQAGTFEPTAVAEVLHAHEFETVLGKIGFDDNGDVYGYEPFTWYVWQEGDYAPVEDQFD
jgi:branched-chain amino acid transport system substrate-binding protein